MLRIESLQLLRGGQPLFAALDLHVDAGEIVTLMGPSGVGKSTLLHWMVGDLGPAFEARGALWLDGERIDARATESRRVGILFQDDLLFAHWSVGQNLAFALAGAGPRAQRRARIEAALADAGLAGFHDRDPATLSGGQRARVSLLRALLAEPRALLLDEPFSRLDAALRAPFRALVFARLRERAMPTLLVTHDPEDVPPGGRVVHLHPEGGGV